MARELLLLELGILGVMMSDAEFSLRVRRRLCRHIFHVWRVHLRLYVAPLFVAFALVDFIYFPDRAWSWLAIRGSFLAFTWIAFEAAARFAAIRRQLVLLGALETIAACTAVNVMIAQSGGAVSLYLPGLILCATTGVQLFKLPRLYSFIAQLGCYGPAVAILLLPLESGSTAPLVSASFLCGMFVLTMIFGLSDEQVTRMWVQSRLLAQLEVDRMRRTEILKAQFPPSLREKIECGTLSLEKQTIVPNAIVGFADIVSSTLIANHVDSMTDWELKERFLSITTRRAAEFDIIVLTHLGDGVLFVSNYHVNRDSSHNLISFCRAVTEDFKELLAEMAPRLGAIESGVRFGAARGAIRVGWLGQTQAYFTAIGPEVNLAARLCRKAGVNEIVVSARAWDRLEERMDLRHVSQYQVQLKGFEKRVTVYRISQKPQLELVKRVVA